MLWCVQHLAPTRPRGLTRKHQTCTTIVAGEGEKNAKFWACLRSHSSGPTLRGRKRPTLTNPILAIKPIWANPLLDLVRVMGLGAWGHELGGLEGWEGPKFRAFFPLPLPFRSFCLSLEGLLLEFRWCFEATGPSDVHV